jgi:zinc/manganese transport system substrate-binding protein
VPSFASILTLALLCVLVAALAACGEGSEIGSDGDRLTAVATTTQVADLTRNVGGDLVEVDAILESGADPHDYEPRPSDVAALADASLVIRSGGDVDEWLGDLIESSGSDGEVVDLIGSVETVGEGSETDPHWWQDPRNAILAVEAIRDALIEADPGHRQTYSDNAAAYVEELERLHSQAAACFERVPTARRKIVTTHDAFAYLAVRYGIEIVGSVIPSLSTQAQPSAKDVERLVSQIEDERVEAVFPESGVSERLEQALSREAGAEVGSDLWADTLGESGSAESTYIGAMAANVAALVDGMTGGELDCRPDGA